MQDRGQLVAGLPEPRIRNRTQVEDQQPIAADFPNLIEQTFQRQPAVRLPWGRLGGQDGHFAVIDCRQSTNMDDRRLRLVSFGPFSQPGHLAQNHLGRFLTLEYDLRLGVAVVILEPLAILLGKCIRRPGFVFADAHAQDERRRLRPEVEEQADRNANCDQERDENKREPGSPVRLVWGARTARPAAAGLVFPVVERRARGHDNVQ